MRKSATLVIATAAMFGLCFSGRLEGQPAVVPGGAAAAVVPGAPAPIVTAGTIDAVTVYRGQALVARVVDVRVPGAGVYEIVVTDLPAQIIGSSIFAEGDGNIEIRNITYRQRVVAEDISDKVRKFDADLRDLEDRSAAIRRQLATLAEHRAYLGKLENFTAPTATAELTRGVLNAETLAKLTTLLLEQRSDIATKELAAGKQLRDLDEQAAFIRRQRGEVAGASSRVAREAVIYANLRNARAGIRLNYLVDSANWTPSYNVRAASVDGKSLQVEYNAAVQQASGEDWKDVQMTLSTATPSLVAIAPALQEMSVALAVVEQGQQAGSGGQYANEADGLVESKQRLADVNRRFQLGSADGPAYGRGRASSTGAQPNQPAGPRGGGMGTGAGGAPLDASGAIAFNGDAINKAAEEVQKYELLAAKPVVRPGGGGGAGSPAAAAEDVAVTYALAARTTLPSRPDRQLIQIAALAMKADFYRVATPVLTPYVYHQALVTNDSKLVLLAGPVMNFVAGQFVGHGAISTVASGQPFAVGLGVDTNLRAAREIVDRTETIQGGNRVITTKVRLSVENFSAAGGVGGAANVGTPVRLMDRIPTSTDAALQIALLPAADAGSALSVDAAYLATERKRGILRWDVTALPQAIGTKALAVEYGFRVEFDKKMSVTTK